MTAICLEYRVSSVHGTTPFASVSDGRAALNYFHSHAGEFGIDPDKIVLAGGSAGGHVAACAALPGIRVPQDGPEKLDPPAVIPAALVLFNPVIDTSENGYGRKKIGEHWQWISPLHQVDATLPPTLILHGTADTTTPFTNVIDFREKARGLGRECTVAAWPGEKHGFFNAGRRAYVSTLTEARNFLTNIGLITSP
jgi:acetyl esterase/lipase